MIDKTDLADLAALPERASCEPALGRLLLAISDAYDVGRAIDPDGAEAVLAELAPALGPLFQAAIYRDGARPKPGETLRDGTPPADLLRIMARVFEVTSSLSGDPRLFARFQDDALLMSKGLPPSLAIKPSVGGKVAEKARVAGRRKVVLPLIHDMTILIAHYFAGVDGGSWLTHHERLFDGHHGPNQRKRLNRDVAKKYRKAAHDAGAAANKGLAMPASAFVVMAVIGRFLSPEGLAALAEARKKAISGKFFA